MIGKKGKMFLGSQEIGGDVDSWKLSVGNPPPEIIEFEGVYDPDPDVDAFLQGTYEIIGTIYGTDGEVREAKMKINRREDGQISLEPVDDDDKEWCKIHCK